MNTFEQNILSPVDGFIDKIDKRDNYTHIYIYIPRDSPHIIYIPVTGTLKTPKTINGIIDDPVFKQAENTHTAEIIWEIIPENSFTPIKFNIQVGKPQFITDSIRIDLLPNNKYKASMQLGEILIGSRAIVSIPDTYKLNDMLTIHENKDVEELERLRLSKGDDVIGGKTILGTLKVYKLNII